MIFIIGPFYFNYMKVQGSRNGGSMITSFSQMSQNNLSQGIQKALDKELEDFIKQIKNKLPSKLQAIKSEINSTFTMIVKNTYLNVFQGYYGNNFDENSLMESLVFMYGSNSMKPEFSYNENVFRFREDILSGGRFNANANDQEFKRFNDPVFGKRDKDNLLKQDIYDSIYAGIEEAQQQGDTQGVNDYLNQLEYIDSSKFNKTNNMQRPEEFVELSQVYKIARDKSIEEFNAEYNSRLKPRILKKYGIKL